MRVQFLIKYKVLNDIENKINKEKQHHDFPIKNAKLQS